ncbi:MAG: HEPN domain-containing protein [Candidatus Omnitrophica bacterium]|nr:HEPN domain-containing protein [Candidatus Omnitrophota bacterium]MDD5671811.1 HEPN domain-containing protein [Candidatus Omnitrophota bacterium]
MKKIDLQDLIRDGQLQTEPGIGWDQVERLIKRSFEDLKSAERNLPFDEPGAMDFSYKAMFHSANALIRAYGFRPGAVRQHQGVILAVERILGDEFKMLILKFDRLRKRRNQFEYQGLFEMGGEELRDSFQQANRFVTTIRDHLIKSNPQRLFDW